MSGFPGVLEVALALTDEGFEVFPLWWIEGGRCGCGTTSCASPGKHPIGALAPHGFKDATSDRDTVLEWWKRFPKANVGVRTGCYGDRCLVVVDIDEREDKSGSREFARLAARNNLSRAMLRAALNTRTTRTSRGGRHLYYWSPVDVRGGDLAAGLQLRSEGGYVVGPASMHESGCRYSTEGPGEIAQIPGWLLNEILARQKPQTPLTAGTDSTEARPVGSRAKMQLPADGGRPTDTEDLRAWAGYEPFARKLLALHGLEIGKRFQPAWRPPSASGPSAVVNRDKRGLHICFDHSKHAPVNSLTLPELHAALTTGKAKRLSPKESAMWTKDALVKTGFLQLPPSTHSPLPPDLTDFDRRVFEGFLRRWHFRKDEPAVAYGCHFVGGWIGLPKASPSRVGDSLRRLREHGLIHKTAERASGNGSMYLYVLGDGSPDPPLTQKQTRRATANDHGSMDRVTLPL